MIFIVVLLTIIALIVLIELILYFRKERHIDFITKNSHALKELNRINKGYTFYTIPNYAETHTYDNEQFYNLISCEDYLTYQLQFIKADTIRDINKIQYNKRHYDKYCDELQNVYKMNNYDAQTDGYNIELLKTLETKLINKNVKKPQVKFEIIVTLYLSNMNGNVYSSKCGIFNEERIRNIIGKLDNKYGNFYKDRSVWDAICRVERGKVSNKMRFSIDARDHYRCRICGRSGNQDFLEIDHIKPISKGGKSTYDNLQTLCRRCNKEKGDTYYN